MKDGRRVKISKGGSNNVHSDYYRISGHGEQVNVLDKKQALRIAKAKVNVGNLKHDFKHGNEDDVIKKNNARLVLELKRKVKKLKDERKSIMVKDGKRVMNIHGKDLDRLDSINHQLPYIYTEIENRGGQV